MEEICGVWKRRDAVKRKENRGGAQVKGPTLTGREFFKNGIHQVTEHPVVCYKKKQHQNSFLDCTNYTGMHS